MKNVLKSATLGLVLGVFSISTAAAQQLEYRKMSTQKVLQEYWRMKDLVAELKKEEESIQKENATKQKDMEGLHQEILKLNKQLQDRNLPRNDREKLTAEYKRKLDRLNSTKRLHEEYIKGKIRALNVQRQEQQQEMFGDVRDAVNEYATKNGLDAVLEQTNVVFMKEQYDITDEIIAIVNKDEVKDDADTKEKATSE